MDLKSADRYPQIPWMDGKGNLMTYSGETLDEDTVKYFETVDDHETESVTVSLPVAADSDGLVAVR